MEPDPLHLDSKPEALYTKMEDTLKASVMKYVLSSEMSEIEVKNIKQNN